MRVSQSGTYLVSALLGVNERNQANTYALGVNGNVMNTNAHNTFATDGPGGQRTAITTQLKLNAGDEVGIFLVSQGTAETLPWMTTAGRQGGSAPSSAISMVKIA
jgi:hypothetical protein